MSRRRTRRQDPRARDEALAVERAPVAERRSVMSGFARDFAILIAVFGATVGIAELAGAANLGVAFGVGQAVFAVALVVLLTRA